MARSLLNSRSEGLGKELAMKGKKGKGRYRGLLALVAIVVAGCGGTASTSDLSSSGGGTDVSSTAQSPAELGVGDFLVVDFQDNAGSMDFTGVADGVKFILSVGSANESGVGSSVRLSTSLSLPDPVTGEKAMDVESAYDESDGYGVEEIFNAWLRAAEMDLDLTEVPAYHEADVSNFKGMSVKAVGLGDNETFRVLSSLSSTSSYVEVTGNVRYLGTNVACYIDSRVTDDMLSDADIAQLCSGFDAEAGEEQDLLGDSSDVDDDGLTHVLMTPQINRLGALGGGIITGYFYAADLYARSDNNQVSNHREVIYTLVPDPDGIHGTPISNAFAMSNLLPAVMPHELQHAISYNQHVFVEGGSSEEPWLNEAMSHFIEDYMGHGRENPSRQALYLASPSTYGIVTQGSPNLLERGGEQLFLRYLYEQASDGEQLLRNLVQTGERGVENLMNAFEGSAEMGSFAGMMQRWSIALAMTDRGISSDSRYVYQPRQRDADTGEWKGVCLDCDPEDGRGTELRGVHLNSYNGFHSVSVDGSAAKFYDVTAIPDEINLSGDEDSFAILIRYE